MSRILFAAKYSWTTLRMSRPLFAGHELRSRGRLSANEKEEKFASNDNARYFHVISCLFRDIFIEPSALMAYIPLCGSRGVVRKNNTF